MGQKRLRYEMAVAGTTTAWNVRKLYCRAMLRNEAISPEWLKACSPLDCEEKIMRGVSPIR